MVPELSLLTYNYHFKETVCCEKSSLGRDNLPKQSLPSARGKFYKGGKRREKPLNNMVMQSDTENPYTVLHKAFSNVLVKCTHTHADTLYWSNFKPIRFTIQLTESRIHFNNIFLFKVAMQLPFLLYSNPKCPIWSFWKV